MHPAPVANPKALSALQQDFVVAGYTSENIEALLGPTASAALDRGQHVPARRVLAQPLAQANPLAGLISCFVLADPITASLAETIFGQLTLEGALDLNIVTTTDDGQIAATVDISTYATDQQGDLWVASDQTALQLGHSLPEEHILGIGKASITLAEITPRTQVKTALDLGTGCGIQAMHLLHHAEHVTITDISQRALDFAVFNILLNALQLQVDPERLTDRVAVRAGNMLAPVEGQTFELVATNPPFVIAPSQATTKHTYRETGQTGDQLVRELISNIDRVLAPGGQAVMLANWEMFGPGQWHERLETWPAPDLDIWTIQRSSADPAQYAEIWLQDSSENLNRATYDAAYERYLQDFEARGVTQIGVGWVWLRRRQTTVPLRKFEYLTEHVHQPVAAAWSASVEKYDTVYSAPTQAGATAQDWILANMHLVAPEWVTYEQYQRFGAEHPEVLMARSGTGFGRHVRLDTATAAVLGACDGELSIGQIVAAVAGLLSLDDDQTAALRTEITALYIDGFLEVYEPETTTS
ncbi:DUF7059 domain-containing protein [Yaniella halotolerans]|uniref:DUF7059 domain-containing protein n=1 Tax=Yaniella halotolerans TaxID=225453 RepID=UPI0003B43CEB|nr:methyltransferase [Yaniella halotolerans]